MTKSERVITRLLQDTGLPYELRAGTKHAQIFVAGRFVGVVSRQGRVDRGGLGLHNLEAAIRRAARAAHGQA